MPELAVSEHSRSCWHVGVANGPFPECLFIVGDRPRLVVNMIVCCPQHVRIPDSLQPASTLGSDSCFWIMHRH